MTNKRTPPICADCRWFAERGPHRAARCTHPDTAHFEGVYGRYHRAARDARGANSECGPDGNLWEKSLAPPMVNRLRDNGTFLFGAIAIFLVGVYLARHGMRWP